MTKRSVHDINIPLEVVSTWQKKEAAFRQRHEGLDLQGREEDFVALIQAMALPDKPLTSKRYRHVMRRFAKKGLPWLAKDQLLLVYRELCGRGLMQESADTIVALQAKPIRSQAGVTVVTVLTKPYPCPGECIFCPTDVRMPKSYLHDEPGAQRAERHAFDPYEQTKARIETLARLGHPVDKIELLILGGTWSSYRRSYQEWFIKRCFDAMNGEDSNDLPSAQMRNVNTTRRNVGLVVETRQDHIDPDELRWLRYLGVTKVQIGIQSMNDEILALNKRGHDAQSTRDAFRMLRLAGFKIQGHWMANLLGATPASDIEDFATLWSDEALRPDELKIYPCMLVENADLYTYWQRGEYQPYDEETLIEVVAACKKMVPRYNRLTRIIRDIPTTNVVEGNKKANLRQIVQQRLAVAGTPCQCIRCREIRREDVKSSELHMANQRYDTDGTTEHFLSFERSDGRIAGFLRLSLPDREQDLPLPELENHAMIREVHVYGPALSLGETNSGQAQHAGLGGQLIAAAKLRAQEAGYSHLSVISAIGTRAYYSRHGFAEDGLYMSLIL